MDGLSLRKIRNIFYNRIMSATINSISLSKNTFILHLYDSSSSIRFDLKAELKMSGVFRIGKYEKLGAAESLEVVNGGKIIDISQRSYDRILILHIAKRKPSGKLITPKIIYELVGNNSNIFVIGDNNNIIFRMNNGNIDPERSIFVGEQYNFFRLNKRYDLETVNTKEQFSFYDLIGFSPKTADYAENLFKRYNDVDIVVNMIKEELKKDEFYIDEKLRIYPFKIKEGMKCISFDEFHNIKQSSETADIKLLKNKLLKYYSNKIDRDRKLVKQLKQDLEKALAFEEYKREADLIMNNLHLLKESAGVVNVYKYTESGVETVEYELKTDEYPESKAEKLYAKSRKLKRSVPKIKNRIKDVENRILWNEEKLFYLNSDLFQPDEVDIYKEYSEIFGAYSAKKRRSEKKNRIYHIKIQDADIYIGKNSRGNHELVFDFANPEDLWLHAKGIPSSHAIIRKSGDFNDVEIETAARCVAYLSKARFDNKVEVDYTLKKYVKKPKNTPEGFVIYDKFKTITVAPFEKNVFYSLLSC